MNHVDEPEFANVLTGATGTLWQSLNFNASDGKKRRYKI